MVEIIDKLVDNAIKKYGLENGKTLVVVENAEKIKENYLNNLIKIY